MPDSSRIAVDVIVPVYRGLDDTRCCIESVLASRCRTPFELMAINDASPEPEVTQWLREAADRHGFTLIENEENLGFVATVNRGMEQHPERDVVLLNSDAEVANDWLDRLHAASRRRPRTASVTPFSNNATICSYPRFPEGGPLPNGWSVAALDDVFAETNPGEQVEIPTAVGFCMYIRRDALDAVGLFDVERFGKGYGEENEFCMRAAQAGWKHVLAGDCFVRHAGGVSFGESASGRQEVAGQVLREMYPAYDGLVARFVRDDPARRLRLAVDLARLARTDVPLVLHVSHALGGGTARHVRDLGEAVDGAVRSLALEPARDGEGRIRLFRPDPSEGLDISFAPGKDYDLLVETLRTAGVDRVHFHHVVGLPEAVRDLPARLGSPYDVTLHDFYFFCPQKHLQDKDHRYCGEPDVAGCRACLQQRPAPGNLSIEDWRARSSRFLEAAERVLAPSDAVLDRMVRHFPRANLRLAPHPEPERGEPPEVRARPLAADEPLRVVVLGALGEIKGADVLEEVATKATGEGAPLSFTLIGFGYRPLRTVPRSNLVVTGPYEEASLPGWLDRVRPHLVWFPAQVPETFSYTLSATIDAGLPVAVTDLGALPERVSGRQWSWVLPWDYKASDWLAFFARVREEHFIPSQPPAVSTVSGRQPDFDYHDDYAPSARQFRQGAPQVSEFVVLADRLMRAERHRGGLWRTTRRALFTLALRLHQQSWPRAVFHSLPDWAKARLRRWLMRT